MENQIENAGPQLADYLGVVRRRLWTILVPFLLATALGVAIAFAIPPEYEVYTTVRVDDPDVVGSFYQQVGVSVPHKPVLSTIALDIKQFEFLEPLINQLDITEGFNPTQSRERTRMLLAIVKRVSVSLSAAKSGPDTFEIRYYGRDAAKVARFVNAIREKYKEEFTNRYRNTVQEAFLNIRKFHTDAIANYRTAQTQLETFRRTTLYTGSDNDPSMVLREALARHKTSLDDLTIEKLGRERMLTEVQARIDGLSTTSTGDTTKVENPAWTKQHEKVATLNDQLAALAGRTTDVHPLYRAKKTEVEAETAKLATIDQFTIQSIQTVQNPSWLKFDEQRSQCRTDIASLTARIEKTQEQITKIEAQMNDVPQNAKTLAEKLSVRDQADSQLQRAERAFQAAFATNERIANAKTDMFQVETVFTAEQARDLDPIFPNVPLFMGVAAIIGLLVGAALAFLGEFSATAFTAAGQVRYSLTVPVLGEIGALSTRAERFRGARRRVLIGVLVALIVAILATVHVFYFTDALKGSLPRAVLDMMRRLYGSR